MSPGVPPPGAPVSRARTLLTLGICLLTTAADLGANWPQWRGPAGNAISQDSGLPVRWSASENLA